MKNLWMVSLLGLGLVSAGFAASKAPIPQPEPTFMDPGTPEQRRAYKIAVLENEIAQDEYIIANPTANARPHQRPTIANLQHGS